MRTRHIYLLLLFLLYTTFAVYAQANYRADSTRIQALIAESRKQVDHSLDSAAKTVQEALELAKKGGYKWLQAQCLAQLSPLYLRARKDVEALASSQEALKIYESLKDTHSMSTVRRDIGHQHFMRGEFNKSFDNYYLSLRFAEIVRDTFRVLNAYIGLGILHDVTNRSDSAIFYYNRAMKMAESSKDLMWLNNLRINVGITYKRKGQYAKALESYLLSLPYYLGKKVKYELAILYGNIGEVLTAMKRFDEAEEYLSKSMDIFSATRANHMVEVSGAFVELYEMKKDYAKALEWHKRRTALSDSFFNIAKSEQLTEMQTKYETEKKEQAIDKLSKEALLQEAQLSRQRLYRNLIIAITLFVLLVAGILYRNYRRSQRFNRQLEEQKARLEELDVIKNKLFSAISHDLRSPMTSLDATLSLLQEQNITKEKLQRYTMHLSTSMNATLNLLDNLLNWSLSQMKGLNLTPATINLKELAEENMQLYTAAAEKKNIRLVSEIDENATAHVDRNIGRLVLRNLINNAIKFTPEKGQIILSSSNRNGEVEIKVKDNGIGMAAEHVKMLFELRMGNTRQGTAKEKGTGLGLVLCKELIEKSGGSISVESEPDKGSTFSVRLPIGKAEKISA